MTRDPHPRRFSASDRALAPRQIVYEIDGALYLNLTNRCNLSCTFCSRKENPQVKDYNLRLPTEPTADELLEQIGDPMAYREIVFCGFGESTLRLRALLAVASVLKQRYPAVRIRLNTNGLAYLVHRHNILPELAPVIDAVSVSLNAADAASYAAICPSSYGKRAYPVVKNFIRQAKKYIPSVTASIVGLPLVDQDRCRQVAEVSLGVAFRVRAYGQL